MRRFLPWLAAGSAVAGVLAYRWSSRGRPFAGRVVLITGGSRGLGLVLARHLADQGARVALMARNRQEVERAADGLGASVALPIVGDVRVPDDARRAVAETIARFGRLDVLVNNAGVILCAPFAQTRTEDVQAMMDVHFWGTLHMTRAALPHLRAQSGARVVNVSSIGGKVGVPHLSAYCASKFAQDGLSSVMTEELREEGVTLSTVYPGLSAVPEHVFPSAVLQVARAAAVASNLPLRLFARVSAWLPDPTPRATLRNNELSPRRT